MYRHPGVPLAGGDHETRLVLGCHLGSVQENQEVDQCGSCDVRSLLHSNVVEDSGDDRSTVDRMGVVRDGPKSSGRHRLVISGSRSWD